MDIETKDGIILRNIPDGTPDEVIKARIAQIRASSAVTEKPVTQTPKPDFEQKARASIPGRIIQGMRDPIDAGAQILSRMVPDAVTDVIDFIPSKMRASSNPLVSALANAYLADPRPKAVDQAISSNENALQNARTAVAGGDAGFDAARLAGNVLSPANAALARVLPVSTVSTNGRLALTGGALGAAGGLMSPVTSSKEQENFTAEKAKQALTGALVGGGVTPIIGNVAKSGMSRLDRIIGLPDNVIASNSAKADRDIADALRELGQKIEDIPAAQMAALKKQVADSLRQGKQLDVAAALRKSDFDALGMEALKGQVTRDPMQFARERNLRGVANVGEPLQARLTGQNEVLQRNFADAASGATDKVTAGERLLKALQAADEPVKGRVDAAYAAARDSLGRAAPMDSKVFSDRANMALDEGMLGHYLPSEVRNILNDVTAGKIPFNVNTAVQIDSVLSAAQRSPSATQPQKMAIGKVREALNSAPIADNVGEDAKRMFDAARSAAAQRFKGLEQNPALQAAVNGEAYADDFVRKYLINGKAEETQRLADVLRTSSPEAFQQARAQIGATLQRAAFGENQAGDKLMTPERLAKALRDIGPQKLGAFFSPPEVEAIKRMARVGAYINSTPAAAAVNTSNTASAGLNLLGRLPVVGSPARIASAIASPVANQLAVRSAMNPAIPASAYVSPEAANRAKLIAALSALGSGNSSGAVGQ